MLDLFISAFITFFVVIDPPGCAPIYASLTSDASAAQRRSMAIRAVAVATIILLIFALIGEDLLRTLGISLASRSEEHTSELQSLMRISYAVFCLKHHNTITT